MSDKFTLLDIAEHEEQYAKDAVKESFETLFSLIGLLDEELEDYEKRQEFDADGFIGLFSLHSEVESSLVFLDSLMDDILDSANRIYPLSKVDSIDKKEKKKIRDISDSTIAAVDDFVVACDEVLDYFAERTLDDVSSASAPHMLETMANLLPNFENIVDSYYDTAIWADPGFDEFYEEDEADEE